MRKRVISLGLCLLLVLSVFVGCSKDSTKTNKVDEKDDNTTVQKEQGEIVTKASEGNKYPITSEETELNIMAGEDRFVQNVEENELTKEYEQKTNVKVKWEMVAQKSIKERLNLALSTGDVLPDVFLNMKLNNQQVVSYGIEQGLLIDLKPYIEKYAPNLKAMFEYDPMIEKIITAPDGGIYTLPQVEETYHVKAPQKAWIYKPWLDKLGLEVPQTTEELRVVLEAFATKDPNGNKKADEIPMTGATTGWSTSIVDFIMNGFIYTYQYQRWIVDEEGNVSVPYNTPEWREGLKYLNGLHKDKLLDEAAFSQDAAQLKQAVMFEEAPLVGVVAAGAKTAFCSLNNPRFKDYVALPPLEGPKGAKTTATNTCSVNIGKFAISNQCKDPAVAIRWIDYFYSQEGTLRAVMGVEGRDWRKAEEGEKGVNDEQGVYHRILKYGKEQNVCWNKLVPCFYRDKLRNGEVIDETSQEKMLYDITKEYYSPYFVENIMLPLFMSSEEAEEIAEYAYLISDTKTGYVTVSYSKFILGEWDVNDDGQWDKYIKQLEGMGLKRFIEIQQKNYKAQYID
jgi:putative aldouronate transport system substrate-binding protein